MPQLDLVFEHAPVNRIENLLTDFSKNVVSIVPFSVTQMFFLITRINLVFIQEINIGG